jgi:hypothetical protein
LTAGEFAPNFAAFDGPKPMNRDTLITVLLVIAGIVLSFVLFGAGVWWKSKTVRRAFLSFDNHAAEPSVRGEFLKGTDLQPD